MLNQIPITYIYKTSTANLQTVIFDRHLYIEFTLVDMTINRKTTPKLKIVFFNSLTMKLLIIF